VRERELASVCVCVCERERESIRRKRIGRKDRLTEVRQVDDYDRE